MREKHVVIVGVASAGKTTMGREAAARLGMPFADNDEETLEAGGGGDIDAMLRKHGEAGWNRMLFEVYKGFLGMKERHIIAASPRLYDRRGFWTLTAKKSVSVHVRSTPSALLEREMKLQGFEGPVTREMKKEYESYYRWRFGHCRKADLELRMKNDVVRDVDALCALIDGLT